MRSYFSMYKNLHICWRPDIINRMIYNVNYFVRVILDFSTPNICVLYLIYQFEIYYLHSALTMVDVHIVTWNFWPGINNLGMNLHVCKTYSQEYKHLTCCTFFSQVQLCQECINWAKDEKRTFLRQALEVNVSGGKLPCWIITNI